MMLIADEGLAVEQQIIDIMTGEQYGEFFTKINTSSFVPVLEDGYLRLIESSAILKCLAKKFRLGELSNGTASRGAGQ